MTSRGLILVVDDDHDIRVALRQAFEAINYSVTSFTNGLDAFTFLKSHRPDLIVLDMVMPLMSGQEFIRIKNADPQFAPIPLLAITAHENILAIVNYHPIMKKPLDLDEFIATAQKLLGPPS